MNKENKKMGNEDRRIFIFLVVAGLVCLTITLMTFSCRSSKQSCDAYSKTETKK
jgi:hypothetical protein